MAWAARDERRYDRAVKFMSMSQENFAIVTGGYLLIGFAIGVAAPILFPLADAHPLLFVGSMMAVLIGSFLGVNFVIERKMRKAGV